MDKYIKCLKCKHKSYTRFGIHLRVDARFSFINISNYPFDVPRWPGLTWKQAREERRILDFYCKRCKTIYPDTKRIIKYIKQQVVMVGLLSD